MNLQDILLCVAKSQPATSIDSSSTGGSLQGAFALASGRGCVDAKRDTAQCYPQPPH
jgi:hypothetical protein